MCVCGCIKTSVMTTKAGCRRVVLLQGTVYSVSRDARLYGIIRFYGQYSQLKTHRMERPHRIGQFQYNCTQLKKLAFVAHSAPRTYLNETVTWMQRHAARYASSYKALVVPGRWPRCEAVFQASLNILCIQQRFREGGVTVICKS